MFLDCLSGSHSFRQLSTTLYNTFIKACFFFWSEKYTWHQNIEHLLFKIKAKLELVKLKSHLLFVLKLILFKCYFCLQYTSFLNCIFTILSASVPFTKHTCVRTHTHTQLAWPTWAYWVVSWKWNYNATVWDSQFMKQCVKSCSERKTGTGRATERRVKVVYPLCTVGHWWESLVGVQQSHLKRQPRIPLRGPNRS